MGHHCAKRDLYKRPVEAFEEAAYRIIAEQVIYHSIKIVAQLTGIIEQYERDFKDVLNQVGINLSVNRDKRYAVATPRYTAQYTAPFISYIDCACITSSLRRICTTRNMNDDGEVFVDLVDFEEKISCLITNRQLPQHAPSSIKRHVYFDAGGLRERQLMRTVSATLQFLRTCYPTSNYRCVR